VKFASCLLKISTVKLERSHKVFKFLTSNYKTVNHSQNNCS